MNTFFYKVVSIDGDYANLKRTDVESDELKLVARALLPAETTEGTMLKYEWLQYEIIEDEKGGFSLVELALVLAIMSLLVCVMIPLILGYVNKVKLSSDRQIADTVKKSVSVVLESSRMLEDEEADYPDPGSVLCMDIAEHFQGAFGEKVAEKLGYDSAKAMTDPESGIVSELRMSEAARIIIKINEDGSCGDVMVISEDGTPLLTVE